MQLNTSSMPESKPWDLITEHQKKPDGDDDVRELLINNTTLFLGLNLAGVPEGEYTFIGLPLRIDTDGAPARVILVKY